MCADPSCTKEKTGAVRVLSYSKNDTRRFEPLSPAANLVPSPDQRRLVDEFVPEYVTVSPKFQVVPS